MAMKARHHTKELDHHLLDALKEFCGSFEDLDVESHRGYKNRDEFSGSQCQGYNPEGYSGSQCQGLYDKRKFHGFATQKSSTQMDQEVDSNTTLCHRDTDGGYDNFTSLENALLLDLGVEPWDDESDTFYTTPATGPPTSPRKRGIEGVYDNFFATERELFLAQYDMSKSTLTACSYDTFSKSDERLLNQACSGVLQDMQMGCDTFSESDERLHRVWSGATQRVEEGYDTFSESDELLLNQACPGDIEGGYDNFTMRERQLLRAQGVEPCNADALDVLEMYGL